MNEREIELLEQIDRIKADIIGELDNMTPREVSDKTIKIASLIDSLAGVLASKEQEYAKLWVDNSLMAKTARETDMMTRASDISKERQEISKRIMALTEFVNALKKRSSMLELEARNQQ